MEGCIFCQIVSGEIPKDFEYEDDKVVAFFDIKPKKPVHILVIPREHVVDLFHLSDQEVLRSIHNAIKVLVEKHNLDGKGWHIEINGGGWQIVNHLHWHLLGPMGQSPIA